jgi:hypothetical protein
LQRRGSHLVYIYIAEGYRPPGVRKPRPLACPSGAPSTLSFQMLLPVGGFRSTLPPTRTSRLFLPHAAAGNRIPLIMVSGTRVALASSMTCIALR